MVIIRVTNMAGLALFQIASVVALIGMGLGWRGVMTKYSGFYDLPTGLEYDVLGIITRRILRQYG